MVLCDCDFDCDDEEGWGWCDCNECDCVDEDLAWAVLVLCDDESICGWGVEYDDADIVWRVSVNNAFWDILKSTSFWTVH